MFLRVLICIVLLAIHLTHGLSKESEKSVIASEDMSIEETSEEEQYGMDETELRIKNFWHRRMNEKPTENDNPKIFLNENDNTMTKMEYFGKDKLYTEELQEIRRRMRNEQTQAEKSMNENKNENENSKMKGNYNGQPFLWIVS